MEGATHCSEHCATPSVNRWGDKEAPRDCGWLPGTAADWLEIRDDNGIPGGQVTKEGVEEEGEEEEEEEE